MEKTKEFFKDEIETIKEVLASGQVKGQEVIDFYNERLKLYNECLNEVNFISVNNCVSGSLPSAEELADKHILEEKHRNIEIMFNDEQIEYIKETYCLAIRRERERERQ